MGYIFYLMGKSASGKDSLFRLLLEGKLDFIINNRTHPDPSLVFLPLYQDRLELISLGGLVPGFSLEAALMGASQPRNGKLAALFYRVDLIEAYGTGLGKILNCYAGLPIQPSFESVEGAFRVVLPNIHATSMREEARPVEESRARYAPKKRYAERLGAEGIAGDPAGWSGESPRVGVTARGGHHPRRGAAETTGRVG